MSEKQLKFEILKLNKEISDLMVLIDTLQSNLRSAVSQLPDDKVGSITNVQSYKWCLNWKPGNRDS
jgi:hypothetical protein